MNKPEQFEQFYGRELLPHLQALEAERLQVAGRVRSAGLVVALVTVAVAIPVAIRAPIPLMGLFPLFLGGIVWAVVYTRMTRAFVVQFKRSIIGRIVRFVDPNLTYHPEQHISQEAYMASLLFPTHPDDYQGEDLVRGRIGKTEIEFSEIHSEYETTSTDREGRTHTESHTIFKGIFFIADFNKHFQGQTLVLPDTAEKLFGRFGRTLQSLTFSRSRQLVQLEDVEFEERFVVYADDQVEARYILSPALMARIVDFAKRTGHQLFISFVSSKIHVAITHYEDLFEPKVFSSLLDMKLVQDYLDHLLLVVGIVEDLNLNTRIWTKQ